MDQDGTDRSACKKTFEKLGIQFNFCIKTSVNIFYSNFISDTIYFVCFEWQDFNLFQNNLNTLEYKIKLVMNMGMNI